MNRKTRLTKNLECNTAECILTCEVALLEAESTVTVSFASHLVTAAVTELPYRSVTVYSWMDVDVYQNNSTVINSRTSTKTRVFLLRPQERGLLDIPLSILLLAVTFSIFLVLLIIACLWKASFFKRHRPPAASGTKRTLSSVYYQDKTEEVEFDVKY
nr:integrin alpha-8-like [Cherax quadricarinatus]